MNGVNHAEPHWLARESILFTLNYHNYHFERELYSFLARWHQMRAPVASIVDQTHKVDKEVHAHAIPLSCRVTFLSPSKFLFSSL